MLFPLVHANAHIAVIPALHQIDIMGKHTDSAQSSVYKHLLCASSYWLVSVLAVDLVSTFG